jgi:hypothetical protein
MANRLRTASPTELVLATPPHEVAESGAVEAIRLLAGSEGAVVVRASREAVVVSGDNHALGVLADTLDNLAATPQPLGGVIRHVDLEYFPGHGFLGENSMWMTVYLLSEEVG